MRYFLLLISYSKRHTFLCQVLEEMMLWQRKTVRNAPHENIVVCFLSFKSQDFFVPGSQNTHIPQQTFQTQTEE